MGLGQCLDKKEVIPYIFEHLLFWIIIPLAFPPIMIIFLDAVMDIFFSYRNALCSWWSLFCYVHTYYYVLVIQP